jgi:hypothetical protein
MGGVSKEQILNRLASLFGHPSSRVVDLKGALVACQCPLHGLPTGPPMATGAVGVHESKNTRKRN